MAMEIIFGGFEMDEKEFVLEFDGAVFRITSVEKKSVLTIDKNGKWTFSTPQMPELPHPYDGGDILGFITSCLLNCPITKFP